jgi:hypothetical protein
LATELSNDVQHFSVISTDICHTHFFTALTRNVLMRFSSVLKLSKTGKVPALFNILENVARRLIVAYKITTWNFPLCIQGGA